MIPVIISGGAGTRLWPVSRQSDPKPFIKLADGLSLLQNTFLRATQLNNINKVITVTNENFFLRMQDEYQQINPNISCDFILEPFGRNTAPAVIAACLLAANNYGADETVLVLPADHLITNFVAFNAAVAEANKIAQDGYLVTFGITPEYPEIGYGYIEANSIKPLHNGYLVKRFVEKPTLHLAQEYINSGNYLWNSGMFLGKVSTFLQEFKLHSLPLYNQLKQCVEISLDLISGNISDDSTIIFKENKIPNNHIIQLDSESFDLVPNISIDYALFEKSHKTAVIPCAINWSDIGSWLSIAEALPKDDNGNAVVGEGILHNVTNCLIHADTNRIVAAVDIEDLVVVDTPDAILVANKHSSQNVKHIFERLKSMEHHTFESHKTVHHVWGVTTILEDTDAYLINQVTLKPHCAFDIEYNLQNELKLDNVNNLKLVVLSGELSVSQIRDSNIETTTQIGINQSLLISTTNYSVKNTIERNVVFLEIIYKKL